MYTVMFEIDTDNNGIKPVLDDYSWWMDLARKIAIQSKTFEIRCWKDEAEAISIGKRFGKPVENHETTEIVFTGLVTNTFVDYLCDDKCHVSQIFTLNFYMGEELLFHSGHYGTEPVIFVKTKEEVQQLEEWSKQYPVIRAMNVYTNEGME